MCNLRDRKLATVTAAGIPGEEQVPTWPRPDLLLSPLNRHGPCLSTSGWQALQSTVLREVTKPATPSRLVLLTRLQRGDKSEQGKTVPERPCIYSFLLPLYRHSLSALASRTTLKFVYIFEQKIPLGLVSIVSVLSVQRRCFSKPL